MFTKDARMASILIATLQLWDALGLFSGLSLNFSTCTNEITKVNQNHHQKKKIKKEFNILNDSNLKISK